MFCASDEGVVWDWGGHGLNFCVYVGMFIVVRERWVRYLVGMLVI